MCCNRAISIDYLSLNIQSNSNIAEYCHTFTAFFGGTSHRSLYSHSIYFTRFFNISMFLMGIFASSVGII